MKSDVVSVDATMPLREVERLLSERGIGGAPVVDSSGKVVGIVSIRDLVDRYADDPDARPRRGRGADAFATEEPLEEDEAPFASEDLDAEDTAGDVMTPEVHWVPVEAGLGDIARAMARHRVHRLLVKDGERYVGLIGTLDVLDALAG
jgi:CBS domain-containing protein